MKQLQIYLIIIAVIFFVMIIVRKNYDLIKFYRSDYHKITGHGYRKTMKHLGNYGEYLIFKELEKVKGYKKILSSVYIKKRSGNYTEVDVIMVHTTGIYVVESKNYKGYISGYPTAKNWTQSLGRNTKNLFYNPLQQNMAHINGIKYYLGLHSMISLHSVVVFSDNANLDNVHIDEQDAIVTKLSCLIRDLKHTIRQNKNMLSKSDVDMIYEKLSKGTHAKHSIKKAQLKNAKKRQREGKGIFWWLRK